MLKKLEEEMEDLNKKARARVEDVLEEMEKRRDILMIKVQLRLLENG